MRTMTTKGMLFLGLSLSLCFALHADKKKKSPVAAKRTVELQGTQQRGMLVLDMEEVDVFVVKHYTVPRGKTLQIVNPGKIKFKSLGTRTVTLASVAPHPIYGGGRSGGERTYTNYASIAVKGRLIIGKNSKEKEKVNKSSRYEQLGTFSFERIGMHMGSQLEVYNQRLYQLPGRCSVKAYRSYFPRGVAIGNHKGQRVFYECMIGGASISKAITPSQVVKWVKFKKCVFTDENRISMSGLWAMEKCDIYGRPFVIKNYKWGRVPKLVHQNYFDVEDFPMYLNHAFAEDQLGVKVKAATQAYQGDFFAMQE